MKSTELSIKKACLFTILSLSTYCLGNNYPSYAQINPDASLPTSSRITIESNTLKIEDGTRAGNNLFHSFINFSVPNGQEAFFNNQLDIQNIIGRVTGASISNINGALRANGAANLFLINPNGIIFGENASLNIGGSFVASTANGMQFGDRNFFLATNPDQSTPTPLLTVNPSALLFSQQQAAAIQNNSRFGLGLTRLGDFNLDRVGLRVPDGKSLLLVGGDINLNGAGLNAYEGRVELGAIASRGSVSLNNINGNFSLNFPNDVARGKVTLSNGSSIDVWGGNGGGITIYARELNISDRTRVVAGIQNKNGFVGAQAGNIDLLVTDNITLERLGRVENSTGRDSTGNAGNVNINTGNLRFVTGGQIQADTNGLGQGGSVNINASNVTIDGVLGKTSSGIFTRILNLGRGNAGNININTGNLSITNGGVLLTETGGQGDAGDVIINAPDGTVKLAGGANPQTDGSDTASAILSSVSSSATGNGGDIYIRSREFLLLGDELKRSGIKSAGLFAGTGSPGAGNAGSVTIEARDRILFDGVKEDGRRAGIFSTINNQGNGKGGTVSLITSPEGSVTLENGSLIINSNFGQGNAGDINISTGSFSMNNNSLLLSQSNGRGNTGTMNITATNRIIFDNESFAFNGMLSRGIGNAQDIRVNTGEFILKNGSALSASTSGQGNAGNIFVNARVGATFDNGNLSARINETGRGQGGNITITTGNNGDGGFINFLNKGALTVQVAGEGKAGSINIATGSLRLDNESTFIAATRGKGDGGQININAKDSVEISDRSRILNNVDDIAVGNGGDIRITTGKLSVSDRSEVNVSSGKGGRAGNINIDARSILLDDGGILKANTGSVNPDPNRQQATINLNSRNLILRHGSSIETNAEGIGVIGGDINIKTGVLAALEDSDITANSADFRGGNVRIEAEGVFGIAARDTNTPLSDITASGATRELQGNVEISNTLDPSRGLIELPVKISDASQQISRICKPRRPEEQSSFTVTGRGNLPPNPHEPLPGVGNLPPLTQFPGENSVRSNLNSFNLNNSNLNNSNNSNSGKQQLNQPIVEAQGWVVDQNGKIHLVAKQIQNNDFNHPECS